MKLKDLLNEEEQNGISEDVLNEDASTTLLILSQIEGILLYQLIQSVLVVHKIST